MKYIVTLSRVRQITEETKLAVDVPDDEEDPASFAHEKALELAGANYKPLDEVTECEDEQGNVSKLETTTPSLEWSIIENDEDMRDLVVTVRKFKSSKENIVVIENKKKSRRGSSPTES